MIQLVQLSKVTDKSMDTYYWLTARLDVHDHDSVDRAIKP